MDLFIEAYGAIYKKTFFFAVRFKRSIAQVKIKNSSVKIDTSDILVLYSNKPVITESNTLTFVVKAPCHTNAISVQTGKESELLLSLLNETEILDYCFHNSVLYCCGTKNAITFPYISVPKTVAFKALYKITKAHFDKNVGIDHFALCRYFKRNKLKWKKWKSWWYFIKNLINDEFKKKMEQNITLRLVNRIQKIGKSSLNVIVNNSDLNFCEISLEVTKQPGILCASNNSNIYYVSPMIVSKQFYTLLPIKDKNNVLCDRWFPLYADINHWFDSSIYFYVKDLKTNIKHMKSIVNLLKNTTIEKYKFIQENVILIYKILTNTLNK